MGHLIALTLLLCIGYVSGCQSSPRKSEKINDTVYLELHVFADNGYMKHFRNNTTEAENYIFRFFQSVSWRFMHIFFPVRFPIVNITFLNETEDEEIFGPGTGDANASATVTKFKGYLDRKYPNRSSDLVYLLTSRNLNGTGSNGKNVRVAGVVGNDGGVCTENNIAVGIDKPGKYTGFLWATRQIAKLMGAKNDGDNNNCPKSDGFLMSNSETQWTYNIFSICSEEAMEANLSNKTQNCTGRNHLRDMNPGPSIGFAGENLTLTERCQAYFGEKISSCREWSDMCITTCCLLGNWYDFTWPAIGVLPTADGQTCSNGHRKCYNSNCMDSDGAKILVDEYSNFTQPSNGNGQRSP